MPKNETALGIMIEVSKKDKFKAACAQRGKSMREILEEFVNRFISESAE